MYSERVRREAMRRAWQTGQPATSGIVQLVQEKGVAKRQPGFLIYVPIYAGRAAPGDASPPSAFATAPNARPIEAFVYAPFRIHDQNGRAHVCTPVTNAHIVCRLLLEKKKQI